jgi:hypothetical protein
MFANYSYQKLSTSKQVIFKKKINRPNVCLSYLEEQPLGALIDKQVMLKMGLEI